MGYRVRQKLAPGVYHYWSCICVLKRQWMIGAYKAGLYDGYDPATTEVIRNLNNLKGMLIASFIEHEQGLCPGRRAGSISWHDYPYQDQVTAGLYRATIDLGYASPPEEPSEG